MKKDFLHDLSERAAAVHIQEVHGTEQDIELFLYQFHQKFIVFHSPHPEPSTGGVVSMFNRCFFRGFSFRATPLVPGRVLPVDAATTGKHIKFMNVHNVNIANSELNTIAQLIQSEVEAAISTPKSRTMFIVGDFNFTADGEDRLRLRDPLARSAPHAGANDGSPQRARWSACLGLCTELTQKSPTHYHAATASCSRIDRSFITTPPWMLTQFCFHGSVAESPVRLHEQHLSDHSPTIFTISLSRQKRRNQQPIAKEVLTSPVFKEEHDKLAALYISVGSLTPRRWQDHKLVIREAARRARNRLLIEDVASNFSRMQSFASTARAVWQHDYPLLERLMLVSPVVREHVRLENGSIFLRDPAEFSRQVDESRRLHIDKRKDDVTAEIKSESNNRMKRKLRGKLDMLGRLAQIWSPFDKRFALSALRAPSSAGSSSAFLRDPGLIADVVSKAWAPIFAHKELDVEKARQFVDGHCVAWDFLASPPPSIAAIALAAKCARDSSPGRDGIPYSAWHKAGPLAHETIFHVSLCVLRTP